MDIVKANGRIDVCIALRTAVFVREQGVDIALEVDENDLEGSACEHFLMVEDGKPIGTFRGFFEEGRTVHLQRLAILKEYRGRGFGRAALRFAEEHFMKEGADKITLGAQVAAIPFYEKCGYECVSDVFDDAGIPHRTMEKRLLQNG